MRKQNILIILLISFFVGCATNGPVVVSKDKYTFNRNNFVTKDKRFEVIANKEKDEIKVISEFWQFGFILPYFPKYLFVFNNEEKLISIAHDDYPVNIQLFEKDNLSNLKFLKSKKLYLDKNKEKQNIISTEIVTIKREEGDIYLLRVKTDATKTLRNLGYKNIQDDLIFDNIFITKKNSVVRYFLNYYVAVSDDVDQEVANKFLNYLLNSFTVFNEIK